MTEEQQSAVQASASTGRWGPPRALTGFVVLLLAVFALAYGIGSAAGPVAPGMRSTVGDPGPAEPGGMGGMNGGPGGGMGGMNGGGR
ncbi:MULTISPECIES: hypothetical protein [Streptomyces]|uniref:Secreted protein n=1 Tax=Streptomyces amritsarensis TaxID=681158 RepID=A0ABX3FZ19_9ACTN|nr:MULTISPECIES: hypothetical protein [Streptomyces]AQT75775.1 hypothetical protein B1K54_32935 [Streptomyces sp. fd1-xmd]MDX6759641.1 hypothetical protein [Streptomyces sp. F8]OLZ62525.1 hypothetical protein AVW11_22565 [Streptomyces amritsarensis]